jgi:hypothetical protein
VGWLLKFESMGKAVGIETFAVLGAIYRHSDTRVIVDHRLAIVGALGFNVDPARYPLRVGQLPKSRPKSNANLLWSARLQRDCAGHEQLNVPS